MQTLSPMTQQRQVQFTPAVSQVKSRRFSGVLPNNATKRASGSNFCGIFNRIVAFFRNILERLGLIKPSTPKESEVSKPNPLSPQKVWGQFKDTYTAFVQEKLNDMEQFIDAHPNLRTMPQRLGIHATPIQWLVNVLHDVSVESAKTALNYHQQPDPVLNDLTGKITNLSELEHTLRHRRVVGKDPDRVLLSQEIRNSIKDELDEQLNTLKGDDMKPFFALMWERLKERLNLQERLWADTLKKPD